MCSAIQLPCRETLWWSELGGKIAARLESTVTKTITAPRILAQPTSSFGAGRHGASRPISRPRTRARMTRLVLRLQYPGIRS